jgi:hypothetical protein
MVLADDNFATIERAVEEGRTIYDNLIKTILFILPTNGAESLMVIVSVLILFEVMPITPLQILWVNMVTAVTLALALAFEPSEEGIMRRPPRPPDEPIISVPDLADRLRLRPDRRRLDPALHLSPERRREPGAGEDRGGQYAGGRAALLPVQQPLHLECHEYILCLYPLKQEKRNTVCWCNIKPNKACLGA